MPRLCTKMRQRVDVVCLTAQSLYSNAFSSSSLCLDTAMQPVILIVDSVVRRLGPVFVVLVVCLTTTVVMIFYVYILPYVFTCGVHWVLFHLIFGHYLLMNIIFHYYKGVTTLPGKPPEGNLKSIGITSVCRKCLSPKPPRTHHCSVCNRCVLKMDHHCPWLNNCVGHYNHRYFLQFCIFMWIGTVYVSISAWPLFYQEFFDTPGLEYQPKALAFWQTFQHPGGFLHGIWSLNPVSKHQHEEHSNINEEAGAEVIRYVTLFDKTFHSCILLEFFLCSGVVVALGALTMWHVRLITRGETSVEAHINRSETKRLKKLGLIYKNPYDFGPLENWRRFLGLGYNRTFWSHIAMPSGHPSDGNGYQWQFNYSKTSNGNCHV
ncbi:palmitoyltransferase ZDHHC16-like [Glandiceps talaboti]